MTNQKVLPGILRALQRGQIDSARYIMASYADETRQEIEALLRPAVEPGVKLPAETLDLLRALHDHGTGGCSTDRLKELCRTIGCTDHFTPAQKSPENLGAVPASFYCACGSPKDPEADMCESCYRMGDQHD